MEMQLSAPASLGKAAAPLGGGSLRGGPSSRLSPSNANARGSSGLSSPGSLAQRLSGQPSASRKPWDARDVDPGRPRASSLSAPMTSRVPPACGPGSAVEVARASGSCCDTRHSASMAFGERGRSARVGAATSTSTFWSTTGMYPQSALVSLATALRKQWPGVLLSSSATYLALASADTNYCNIFLKPSAHLMNFSALRYYGDNGAPPLPIGVKQNPKFLSTFL